MQSICRQPRSATLVGEFDRSPAYAGLANALTQLIGDGRIGLGTRLPSERELTEALGVSRTTVTRAYAALRDAGYAEARQGAGTFTRVPGGQARAHDRALLPRPGDHDAIDLNCAAASAPPGIADGVRRGRRRAAGVPRRPRLLPRRAPRAPGRDRGDVRGARAADRPRPDPGDARRAVGGVDRGAGVHRARRPGARRVAGLPQRDAGDPPQRAPAGHRSPVDPDGWDLDAVGAALATGRARLAYLIPDFQNPTGHLMTDAAARAVRRPPAARPTPSPSSTRRTPSWPSTARRCRGRSRRSRPTR